MASLGSITYDPGTAVQFSTASALAMTAIDTTNLRKTVTVPANGIVVVRARAVVAGASSSPRIFLGVMESSTVLLRQMAAVGQTGGTIVAGTNIPASILGVITGLSPGSHTLDLAYGVESAVAATNLQYGGPNDAAGADASGSAVFDVYDSANVLAAASYDPSTAASKSVVTLAAMAVIDTTNLRLTITAPSSGLAYWRIRTCYTGSSTPGSFLLGVMESSTVVARESPTWLSPISGSTIPGVVEATGTITGLSGGSHTLDAAWGVQTAAGSGGVIKWGGPNDTTATNAWGAITFELWSA